VTAATDRRLPAPWGRFINRSRPVTLRFEGVPYPGYEGDTVASALVASGRRILSRSFKYHRPRGPFSMAGHDANCLVRLSGETSVRADLHPVSEGLEVRGQNFLGSLDRDLGACMGWFGRCLPAGFYYKTFHRPRGAWVFWEKFIRRVAGLGRLELDARRETRRKRHLFADVAVIGGGPAGLSAALQAAAAGADVFLIDDQPQLGGSLNFARLDPQGHLAETRAAELRAQVEAAPGISAYSRTTCTGWFQDNLLSAIGPAGGMLKLRAKAVVAATGAIEQPLVFRNNDLPGVMLGTAAQKLMRLYGVKPGLRAVVATAGEDGYGVALDLLDAGIEVAAIAELRQAPPGRALERAARERQLRVVAGATVFEALPADGGRGVGAAAIARIGRTGAIAESAERISCDLICVSVGYAPAAQLICHAGGRLAYEPALGTLVADALPDGGRAATIAGSVNGCRKLDAALAEGRRAGAAAAQTAGRAGAAVPAPAREAPADSAPDNVPVWPIFPHPKGREFVDLDEDVQIRDIADAVAEGFDQLELTKRYTTAVMGPSQGRHSALNLLRLASQGAATDPAGRAFTTTQRPPCFPERLEDLAGRSFEPVRLSAMHERHLEAAAQMQVVGAWLRPSFYGALERREAQIRAEALNVRNNVGLVDVSTLGKLEIAGPDAAEFVDRMYMVSHARQQVGRCRYTVMADEFGTLMDDGIACRLGEGHFYVTATTGGVEAVFRAMLRWNAEWRLDVGIANVTAACAAVNLAGPNSRKVLRKLVRDLDLSAAAFPFMELHEADIAGIPARLMRAGFVGELGYEIHAPASQGEALWDALMTAGKEFGIRPFGVEAQRLLRLEKGFLILHQDTDGLCSPREAGMAWAVSKNKPFFVGKRPIAIRAAMPLSRVLVGFVLPPESPLPEECHLTVRADGEITGYVTSIAFSPTLGRPVGMAFVAPEQQAPGARFLIKTGADKTVRAETAKMPFYDPEGRRQKL